MITPAVTKNMVSRRLAAAESGRTLIILSGRKRNSIATTERSMVMVRMKRTFCFR